MTPALQGRKLETVNLLRDQLRRFHTKKREFQASGVEVLDQLLPGGGAPCGGIIEWLGDAGSGAATLSLVMARRLCGEEGMLALVDGQQQLYPPAMSVLGIDLDRILIVHPRSRRDKVWSLIQCLRCPSVAVAWGYLDELNAREYRCLQLAAEASGVMGMFVRPTDVRGQPSWADVQLLVTPQASAGSRRFAVEVVNCQQGPSGKSVTIDMDAITGEMRECDESIPLRLAPELADPPAGRRAAGA